MNNKIIIIFYNSLVSFFFSIGVTNNGYINIEDVSFNDKLLSHTGKFQNIINLQKKNYNGYLYEITFSHNYNKIICTEEHPFYIREKKFNSFGKAYWKKINKITNNDYFGMIINNKNIIPYISDNIKLYKPEYWFLIGYYIINGYIYNNFIYLHIPDNLLEKISHIFNIKKIYNTLYEINNKSWFDILYKINHIIPEWIQNAPDFLIKEFINGFNYINKNDISYELALGIQRLYLKLGIICIIEKSVNNNDLYNIIKIKNNNNVFIDNNYIWYSFSNITKKYIKNVKVYNFEVYKDNSYIVENIIVHNCNSFSNAGKKGNLTDERGKLFEDILRIANEKKPKFMFLENVKHIKKIDNGKTFSHICKRIKETGYYIKDNETIFELSPHQLGIPQHRERVIFVCIRNDIYDSEKKINFDIPFVQIDINKILETDENIINKYKIPIEIENILNIWDEMINKFEENETLSPTIMCNEFYKTYNDNEFTKLPLWKQDYISRNKPLYNKYKTNWDQWYNKNKELLEKKEIYGKLEWQTGKKKQNDSIWNYFIQLRQSGIRVKKSDYFPTLVAIVQTPIYAKEKRYITPRECARLQSFPDNFIIHKNDNIAYKQFGNAVNVDVVSYVINLTLQCYDFI